VRQEDQEFKASLGYIAGTCLKKKKKAGVQWLISVIPPSFLENGIPGNHRSGQPRGKHY
jgi:hypothetical protein